jgi:bifunctional non-homologous end joining protein LigD
MIIGTESLDAGRMALPPDPDPAAAAPVSFDMMQPRPVPQPPDGDDWLHEIKFEGHRIVARLVGGTVRLTDPDGTDRTAKFPEIAAALAALPVGSLTLDGQIVALSTNSRTSLAELEAALKRRETSGLVYMIFDLIALDGRNLREERLAQRKTALVEILALQSDLRLRYSDHRVGNGGLILRQARSLGIPGIVSKRTDSPYSAVHDGDWLEIDCLEEDAFTGWVRDEPRLAPRLGHAGRPGLSAARAPGVEGSAHTPPG